MVQLSMRFQNLPLMVFLSLVDPALRLSFLNTTSTAGKKLSSLESYAVVGNT